MLTAPVIAFDGDEISTDGRLPSRPEMLGTIRRRNYMDLDLTCVASLLVLYEEQHHGRAAARLRLTPSALTKRIQRLERQVGVKLVTRGATAAEPTPAGHRFCAAATSLLRDADAARKAALTAPARDRRLLVLGIPAGPPQNYLRRILPSVMSQVRAEWPGSRLACRLIPLAALHSSLLGGEVDVLWSVAPVAHRVVTSTPLNNSVGRIGVVDARHALADAGAIDVMEFAALPAVYDPTVPDEVMSTFYLGDIRGRPDAHLIPILPRNSAGIPHEAARLGAVTVGLSLFTDVVGPGLRAVQLLGAPPVHLYASRLRREHRGAVHSLVAALRKVSPGVSHLPAQT